jgi:hypothetical protein
VANFVCTAWPVDDWAAREFALRLYEELLGLRRETTETGVAAGQRRQYDPIEPQPMHLAVRKARRAIADLPEAPLTWGAYQHYGDPFFRFFDPTAMSVG